MSAANRRIYLLPILILVLGILGSMLLLTWLVRLQKEKISRDFSTVASDRSAALAERIQAGFSISESIRELFHATDFVTEMEFHTFVNPQLQRAPELNGVAWAREVKSVEGRSTFPILYLQTQGATDLSVGKDLASLPEMEPIIRKALETQQPQWINLPGSLKKGDQLSNWVIIQPVTEQHPPSKTDGNNSVADVGVILTRIDLDLLISSAFKKLEMVGLDAEIYEATLGKNRLFTLWFSHTRVTPYDPVREASASRYTFHRNLQIADREWTISCRPAPAFLARYQWWEQGFIVTAGVLLSVLLAIYLLRQRLAEAELRRQNETISILENVAVAANEAESNEQLLQQCLRLIRDYLGWSFGHVYLLDEASGRLISKGIFDYQEDHSFEAMRQATEEVSFADGEGLPGRISLSEGPIFIPDVQEISYFLRSEGVRANGLHGYVAFPVLVRKKVMVVMEFLDFKNAMPADGWSELFIGMSSQIAHAMERRLAADELLEKTAVLENAVEGISRVDLAGNYLSVNKAYARMCGRSAADLIGTNDRASIHPDDVSLYDQAQSQLLEKGRGETKVRRQHSNGSYFHQDLVLFPDLDPQGKVRGSYLFGRDITEREAQQRELRESEERFMAFMGNSPASAAIKDEKSRLVYINRACSEQFGFDFTEVLGKSPEDLLGPEVGKTVRANDELLLAQGKPMNIIEVIPDRHGEMRHWMVYKFPMKGLEGKRLIGVLCLDITERLAAEKAIATARDEAIESVRLKSQFLANMSHEIRTPMNGLIGMLGLLGRTPLEPDQRELLQTASGAADSLLRLLNDILDFSKIEAGKLEIDPVIFDPRQCVRHAVKLLREPAQKKNLELTHTVADEVPAYLEGDSGRLTQMIVNLVNNAIKFTPRGSVSVSLDANPTEWEGEWLLHGIVRDTGIGVPESHREIIFQPFRQSDSSTARQYGGTGLGLAICSQLAGLMGGEIWLESEPSGGSAFHFTVAMKSAQQPLPAVLNHPAKPNFKPGESLRILLAEDNEINQKLAVALLEKRGHRLVLARDGHEAVALFQKSRFDLILMDVQMPGKDGYQATIDIRNDPNGRDIPIYAVTAHAMPEDRRRCLDVGMNEYLTKPIQIDEFARLVEARVQRGRDPLPIIPPTIRTRRIDWQPKTVLIKIPETPRIHFQPKSFDLAALRQLVNHNDPLIAQLASSFARQGIEDRDQMRLALAEHDAIRMERATHRLKGSARSLSATTLAEIAQDLETAAHEGNFLSAETIWPRFEAAFEALLADLSQLNGQDKRVILT